MENRLFILFMLCFSIVLYWISPNTINSAYIAVCFICFSLCSFFILKNDKKRYGLLNFNTFFLFSFFLVSFCFPFFILGSSVLYKQFENVSMSVFQYVDFSCITKVTCLSLVAFFSYLYGYEKHTLAKPYNTSNNRVPSKKILNLLLFLSTTAVFINVILTIKSIGIVSQFSERPFIYDIYKTVIVLSFVLYKPNKLSNYFVKQYFWPLLSCILVSLLFLYFGDRSMVLFIGLVLLSFYSYTYKYIGMKKLLVLLCVGTVIMYSVRVTRKSDSVSLASGGMSNFIEQSSKSINEVSPIILFSDLIGACQELCVGYQYKEKNGLHYPSQIWIIPFNAIPFLPNILSEQIYGMSQSELAGGQNYNNYMASQNVLSTFGKHMVSDIYMRWGEIGVILFFILFGTTVGYYQKRRSDDKKYLITWIMLIGMSVYLSRSSILDIIRPIFYVYLFYYLCIKKSIERYENTICK